MKRLFIIILFCIGLIGVSGCRAVPQDQASVVVDNGLSQQDLFALSSDFFYRTCLDVLGEFASQYNDHGTDAPDYAATRLSAFTVRTAAHSSHIARIDIKFQFNDGDKVHSQSIVIMDGKVLSNISSSPKTTSLDPDIHTISLSDFIAAIEDLDFSGFAEIKPDADLYTIDFEAVSDIFYHNTGNAIRYLISPDGMIDGNREDDMQLDRYVPVIMFCDYIESDPGQFLGDDAVQIFINK